MTKQEIIDKVNDIYQWLFDYYLEYSKLSHKVDYQNNHYERGFADGVSLACRYLVELHYEILKEEGK